MTRYTFTINAQTFDVEIQSVQANQARVTVNHVPYEVTIAPTAGRTTSPTRIQPPAAAPTRIPTSAAPIPVAPRPAVSAPSLAPKTQTPAGSGAGTITAQIPGKMINIGVDVGASVASGQVVAVMEAMKMENNILSPMNGTVKEIRVSKGSDVATGDVLMVIV